MAKNRVVLFFRNSGGLTYNIIRSWNLWIFFRWMVKTELEIKWYKCNILSSYSCTPPFQFLILPPSMADNSIRVQHIHSSMDEIIEVLECNDTTWKLVDSTNSQGNTLLHLAISQKIPNLVQLLLEIKPNIESIKPNCTSFLVSALPEQPQWN